nr:LOW QUALITY PROTEIN: huntingtin-associated protein 1 [Globicephala melas]
MRPQELGQGSAGDWPGPGDPAAVTPAPPPAANPAPEPSAEPEPAPVQVPAAGQAAGSGSATVSGPSAGARPASKAGSEAGVQRASAFSAVQGNAQSVPDNSDAPRTRFIFQGPFGPRAAGLGTGKAAGIWKTPAAYIGRRPGVSGPERASFIRELEEALCPDLHPPVKKITQEDVKVMLSLLEELLPSVWEIPETRNISPWMGVPLQRERDLNTAARIGQSLVKQNSVLTEENSKLEAMLGSAREKILHLRHQVSLRDDLLQLYSDSDDEEEEDEEDEEEERGQPGVGEPWVGWELGPPSPCTPTPITPSPRTPLTESEAHHCPQLEALQERLRLLEEENEQLREEVSQLDDLEEEGQMFILGCVEQFSEASQQMAELSEVLALRMQNYEQQQREAAQLRAQVTKLQQCCQAEALPDFQETLAEELRTSIRRIISDPVYFMERCTLGPRPLPALHSLSPTCCELHYSEDREREQGLEAEEGLMSAEDFAPAEELVPAEELGATGEALPADEGVTEEAELVSEEAEAWEEAEPELDEATRMNVVTSALDASGLGPSCLDMKYVLQQLANWQDAHYRQQLRQKMLQKGECSRGGLPSASRTSCRS